MKLVRRENDMFVAKLRYIRRMRERVWSDGGLIGLSLERISRVKRQWDAWLYI